LQNLFAISICAGIGMLIGIVIGTLIEYVNVKYAN